jgi:1-acyl-sn-glycerol-3-phosphate acyltransferase
VRTIVIVTWAAAATFGVGVFVIGLSALGHTSHTVHRVAGAWARSILTVSRIRVVVRGLERIRPEQPYVFMSNHQSNFDIPVVLGFLPVQFRWLAKTELFKIPIFGRAMRGAGYISIDRSDRPSAFESLRRAAEIIRGGVSILVFPEGTRSLDGRLKPFKKGGFVLAIEAGVPIVPVAILGTHAIMPKGSLLIRPRDVNLCIGEPIATTAYTLRTKEALMEQVRHAIRSAPGGMKA